MGHQPIEHPQEQTIETPLWLFVAATVLAEPYILLTVEFIIVKFETIMY